MIGTGDSKIALFKSRRNGPDNTSPPPPRSPQRNKNLLRTWRGVFQDSLRMQAVDPDIKAVVAAGPDRLVVFSHLVYLYFERRYTVRGTRVPWEPDQMQTRR